MSICFKDNWDDTIQRFDAWFHNKPCDRPLMSVWVMREEGDYLSERIPEEPFDSPEDMYLNADKHFAKMFNMLCREFKPMAEAFPEFSMNLGAGSMALYLGGEPVFAPDTLWFKHFAEDYKTALPLRFDPENKWWKKHLEILNRQVELCRNTDIAVCIPDIIENIDILSAIRNPQDCCFDLYDNPDDVKRALDDISRLYPVYYDAVYNMVKRKDNSSAYTSFKIIGPGKTAKIQCDFAALMSPEHFTEFILPSLESQCAYLDNTVFHLDGPECFPHVDALMSIEKLGALQWTPGTRNPDAGEECWFDLYKKVRNAQKGLWIGLYAYPPEDAVAAADRIVRKFGHKGLYFIFPYMNQKQANELMVRAEKEWSR